MRVLSFVAGIAGCTLVAGCGVETVAGKATVSTIDRTCEIIETTTHQIDDPRAKGSKLDAAEMKALEVELTALGITESEPHGW